MTDADEDNARGAAVRRGCSVCHDRQPSCTEHADLRVITGRAATAVNRAKSVFGAAPIRNKTVT